jgi:hypothetical protein
VPVYTASDTAKVGGFLRGVRAVDMNAMASMRMHSWRATHGRLEHSCGVPRQVVALEEALEGAEELREVTVDCWEAAESRCASGSVEMPLCMAVQPRCTRAVASMFGSSVCEAAMNDNCTGLAQIVGQL